MTYASDSVRPGPGDAALARAPRARRPRAAPPGRLSSIPVTIRFGIPLLLVAFLVHRFWPRRIAVRAVGFLGTVATVDDLTVEVFPFDDSGAGRYPPQATATLPLDGGELHLWRADVPPTGTFLRVDSPVHGIATAHVAPHREQVQLELGVPQRLVGRVQDTDGRGLVGAKVTVQPHPYGPLLGSAETDAGGEFAVDRLSSSSSFFTLRVVHTGYAARDLDVQLTAQVPVVATLTRTRPIEGRVELPPGVAASELELRALRVPGVTTRLLADGAFYLDCLPMPPTTVRLLVAGLPAGWTHPATWVSGGKQGVVLRVVRAATVRGVVVTADRDHAVPGAYVEHPHGPLGGAGAYADGSGRFTLGGLPPGQVRIDAFGGSVQSALAGDSGIPFGFAEVEVEEGKDIDGVVVRVAPKR